MEFKYIRRLAEKPLYSLGDSMYRFHPMIEVKLVGPSGDQIFRPSKLDTGSDDTVFPSGFAAELGIDLTNAPEHESEGAGGHKIKYKHHKVIIEIISRDSNTKFVWNAIVGFGDSIKHPLLGYAGVLRYFDICFRPDINQFTVEPNSSFPGERVLRK